MSLIGTAQNILNLCCFDRKEQNLIYILFKDVDYTYYILVMFQTFISINSEGLFQVTFIVTAYNNNYCMYDKP